MSIIKLQNFIPGNLFSINDIHNAPKDELVTKHTYYSVNYADRRSLTFPNIIQLVGISFNPKRKTYNASTSLATPLFVSDNKELTEVLNSASESATAAFETEVESETEKKSSKKSKESTKKEEPKEDKQITFYTLARNFNDSNLTDNCKKLVSLYSFLMLANKCDNYENTILKRSIGWNNSVMGANGIKIFNSDSYRSIMSPELEDIRNAYYTLVNSSYFPSLLELVESDNCALLKRLHTGTHVISAFMNLMLLTYRLKYGFLVNEVTTEIINKIKEADLDTDIKATALEELKINGQKYAKNVEELKKAYILRINRFKEAKTSNINMNLNNSSGLVTPTTQFYGKAVPTKKDNSVVSTTYNDYLEEIEEELSRKESDKSSKKKIRQNEESTKVMDQIIEELSETVAVQAITTKSTLGNRLNIVAPPIRSARFTPTSVLGTGGGSGGVENAGPSGSAGSSGIFRGAARALVDNTARALVDNDNQSWQHASTHEDALDWISAPSSEYIIGEYSGPEIMTNTSEPVATNVATNTPVNEDSGRVSWTADLNRS